MLRGKIENRLSCAFFVAAAVLLGFAIPVCAQENDVQETDVIDWTGPYLGITLSGGRATSANITTGALYPAPSRTTWGTQIGGQFGFDSEFGRWSFFGQSGRWVAGAEGELGIGSEAMRMPPVGAFAVPAICRLDPLPGVTLPIPPGADFRLFFRPGCGELPTQTSARKIDTLGMDSARLRGGIAWRRWLIYGVGGVILQSVRMNARDTYLENDNFIESDCQSGDPICFVTATERRNLWGWTAGIGGEFAVDKNFTVALEYRRGESGRNTFTFDHPIFSGAPEGYGPRVVPFRRPAPSSVSLSADRVALRLNYRFFSS